MERTPFFLDGPNGALFCLFYGARAATAKHRMLVVPPFGEELNKCRRLINLTATELADNGCDVLVVDLIGTGDSEGVLGECGWRDWEHDIVAASAWLDARSPATTPAVLTIRSGSLLLPYLPPSDSPRHILMWQPVFKGEQFLKQFLRLRVLSNRFAGIEESVTELIARFDAGEPLEVAGYEISADMARGIMSTEIDARAITHCARFNVFEFRQSDTPTLSAPANRFLAEARERSIDAHGSALSCPQFWATQEVVAPAQVASATVSACVT